MRGVKGFVFYKFTFVRSENFLWKKIGGRQGQCVFTFCAENIILSLSRANISTKDSEGGFDIKLEALICIQIKAR